MTSQVQPEQRYTGGRRCSVCGGADGDPRGQGKRCSGFVSSDGKYAHCSREEHAGRLGVEAGGTYAHRLRGLCKCGATHGEAPPADGRDIETTYDFRDEHSELLFQVVRLAGKRFLLRRPDGGDGWIWSLKNTRRVLYKLPELLAAPADARVVVVEGEKDVDTLRGHGVVATCNPQGAGKWKSIDECAKTALRNRHVVIIPDIDDHKTGEKHAADVKQRLTGIAASVRICKLPAHDASDWFAAGGTVEQLEDLLSASIDARTETNGPEDDKPHRKTAAQVALELFQQRLEGENALFHDADGVAYVTVRVGDHAQTWSVRSRAVRSLLRSCYFERTGNPLADQAVKDALATLEARAEFAGKAVVVATRIAEHAGAIYLDLCDERWRAIKIARDGWNVVESTPVKFRRPNGMRALPVPTRGGSLAELRPFVNVASESDWTLTIACLVAMFRPRGPFPVLELGGKSGSAKTSTTRVIRQLVDPNMADDRGAPRDERDITIAARNSHVLAYDNLPSIPQWLSDVFCRLSTGAGYATRSLFTDDEETIFRASRPVIINGIDGVASADDLLSRTVRVVLAPIPRSNRKSEREFWSAFHTAQPRILGALLDAVACALRRIDAVKLVDPPRMADFAEWATAAEPGLGLSDGAFMRAYVGNIDDAHRTVLENSLITAPLRVLLAAAGGTWHGTMTMLLTELTELVPTPSKDWPRSPRALSAALSRAEDALENDGVRVVHHRRAGNRNRDRLLDVTDDRAHGRGEIDAKPSSAAPRRGSTTVGDVDAPDDLSQTAEGVL